ncbi:MAG: hypothetical protein QOF37_63 [Thermoleophilaceae bacterium]|jgi:hypothetical protein|nr:hypothetical protein [Thermoleophilaceae bacterium]
MELRRVRTWEWLTGLAGVVLLVSLFLPWYGAGGVTVNAWDALSVVDVILAVVALAAIALPIVAAFQRTASVPQSLASVLASVSLVGAVIALIRLLAPPGSGDVTREIGAWLGAAAAVAIFFLDWRSMRDKSFPPVMRPPLHVETIPAPAADGTRRDAP